MSSLESAHLERCVGQVVRGTYRLERLLGAGAMGAVYEAYDRAGQAFAVKLLQPALTLSPSMAERFWREARIGAIVHSNHVAPVVESGEESGTPFLVMPLLNGYDVAGLLERLGPLPPDVAVRFALQACEGLAAAHAQGVVHRDIKPSNLFLHFLPGGEVVLKVCDFGVAKRAEMYDDSDLTRTGASMGSPLYMSPEQVTDAKSVDAQTDVWSLAVTLYELLTGVTPYGDAATLADLMVRICSSNATSLQVHAPWVSPQLTLAIHRGLCRDRAGRHQSASAFAQSLRHVHPGSTGVSAHELAPLSEPQRRVRAAAADTASVSTPEGRAVGLSSSAEASRDPLIGAVLGEQYRITRLLGRGGMGSVYQAETQSGERVAVKVISQEDTRSDLEALQRFLREAKASSAIDDAHVARTIAAGVDRQTGSPFIVMELLNGVDLAVLLKRQGALMPEAVVRLSLQAAEGLSAAHARGIVHRDVKPANLFLSVRSGDPEITVKICDFGVAKRILDEHADGEMSAHDLTRTGGMLGSPMYMSPEQAKSAKTVDHRADIWSLGISMYEALTGRRPWDQHTTLGQIIVAICTEPLPPIQEVAPWIEPALANVVHRALEKDPKDRYSSVGEMIEALHPLSGGSPQMLRDELRGVDRLTRSKVAPRVQVAQVGVQSSGSTRSSWAASEVAVPPKGSKKGLLAAAVVGVAVLGIGGAALYTRASSQQAVVAAEPPPTATSESKPLVAKLPISPADAKVSVDGVQAPVVAGKVRLEGQPGDAFEITVFKGDTTRTLTVVLARDGSLNPARVELTEAPPRASAAIAKDSNAKIEPSGAIRTSHGSGQKKPSVNPTKSAPEEKEAASKPTSPAPAPEKKSQATPAIKPINEW